MGYKYDDFLPEGSLEDFRNNFVATLQKALESNTISDAAKVALNNLKSEVEQNA